jgi:flagellar hook assembly protein FlgD
VFDYPFQSPVGVGEGSAKGISSSLRVSPTPARGQVEIALASAADLGATARLAIVDASGRTIRRMEGPVSQTFLWDGRDASGRTAPAGIYWALMEAAGVSYRGKITLMR